MRVLMSSLCVLCVLLLGGGKTLEEPSKRPEPTTTLAVAGGAVSQTAVQSKPLDLSYVSSKFVAGIVVRPRQFLQSPLGRTAIATAFNDDEFDQSMKMFSDEFGMNLADVEQAAVLFTERNIAVMNGIDMPTRGGPSLRAGTIQNNMRYLALAFHNFHDVYNRFPGYVKPGKGKLSWRVYILPYMEEFELYEKFDLDEDWDSETNKPLIAEMPDIFRTRGVRDEGMTAFHITEPAFPVGKKIRIRDFTDGTSNTIMHVMGGADTAIEWTKPNRLNPDEEDPWAVMGDVGDNLWVTLADGSVQKLSAKRSGEELLGLITPAGREVVELNDSIARASDPQLSPTFIVHTAKPLDKKRILEFAAASYGEPKQKRGNGQTYYDHEGYAIWFPTDRTLVATQTMTLPSVMSKRKGESRFRDALVANEFADIVGAWDFKGMPVVFPTVMEDMPAWFPPAVQDIEWVVGAIDLSSPQRPIAQAVMATANAKSAKPLCAMLNGLFAYVGEVKGPITQEVMGGSEDIAEMVLGLLTSEDIQQDGTKLTHTVAKPVDYQGFVDQLKPQFEQLGEVFRSERERAKRFALTGNMKNVGLAFHNHHDVYRSFGAADGSLGDERDGGLSWRVHLLPFLGEGQLYKQFKLKEPWDSEHNKKLISRMPAVFKVKGVEDAGKTSVHLLLGDAIIFGDGKTTVGIDDCIDGTSNTILAVVAGPDTADTWTKPGGLQVDPGSPAKALGNFGDRFQALFADGSVHFLSKDIDREVLHALMTNAGREVISTDDFED